MGWDVEYTDEFETWWKELTLTEQAAIDIADQLYDDHLATVRREGGNDERA